MAAGICVVTRTISVARLWKLLQGSGMAAARRTLVFVALPPGVGAD